MNANTLEPKPTTHQYSYKIHDQYKNSINASGATPSHQVKMTPSKESRNCATMLNLVDVAETKS